MDEGKGTNKKFLLLYLNDLRWGIIAQWKRFLLFGFFCAGACLFLKSRIDGMNAYQSMNLGGTVTDYLLNLFHGMERYEPSSQKTFNMPIVYMGIFILISLIIGNYTLNDLSHRGIQTISRCKSRFQWMFSKILWNVTAVGAAYFIMVVVAVLYGGEGMQFTSEVGEVMHFGEVTESGMGDTELLFRMIGMSFLVSITFAQMQMTISLLLSPIAAYLFVICLTFLSAYITSPFLLENYWMLQRNQLFLENGMQNTMGIIMCLGILCVSVITDLIIIKHKSIL